MPAPVGTPTPLCTFATQRRTGSAMDEPFTVRLKVRLGHLLKVHYDTTTALRFAYAEVF